MGDRINNMGKMMSNPQQRNIYLLGAGAVILTLGVGFFIASKNKNDQVVSGAQIENVPGNVKAVPGASNNPDYNDAIKKNNEKEANKAIQNGASFVPTVTAPAVNSASSLDEIAKKQQQEAEEKAKKEADRKKAEDEEKAKMEEETKRQQALLDAQKVQVQQVQVQQVQVQQPVQQVIPQKPKKYTDDDYMLIASLNNNWKIKNPSSEYDFAKGKSNASNNVNTGSNVGTTTSTTSNNAVAPIAKAGTIYNAIIETAVNSDEDSPVLARIVSGPLKGTRLIGTFKNLGEKVAIVFSTANIPSLDKTIKLNAYAIDTNTSRTALADDVDHHYFLRYGVLLATSFISGYADALSQSGSTRRRNPTTGYEETESPVKSSKELNKIALGNVGKQASDDIKQQYNNLKPTIYVNSGTAVGILLMDDLTVK